MTAPRPHAELAARLRNIECSLLDEDENATLREAADLLDPGVILRIKPTTVHIGGMELEGPLREVPEHDTKLWLLFDHTPTPDVSLLFSARLPGHIKRLNEGRLFASKEARDKYQDALVKLANGETK